MANPTTNYGWPMPTSTDLVTDLPADFAAFGQPVDTSLKALNPETTLGDIAYRSATANTNTRLAIGSTGNVLTVAGGVPTWAAGVSGGMTLLSTTSLTTTTTTISDINQSYINLYIEISGINWGSNAQQMNLQYNGVTSGYYGAAIADYQTGVIRLDNGTSIFTAAGAAHGTDGDSICSIEIPSYSVASRRHTLTLQHNYSKSTPGTLVVSGTFGNGSTSAVSSFTVISSVTPTAGTVKIYGVK
jgi:hypothetical protein